MADTGWKNPGTIISVDPGGDTGQDWSNPSNATTSNDSYAICTLGGVEISDYLRATNFSFSVPSGATINGIEVRFELYHAGGTSNVTYEAINLIRSNGSIGTGDKSDGSDIPDSEAYESFGGSSDLWSDVWSSTDINDSDFGVQLQLDGDGGMTTDTTAYVDNMQVRVYYTEVGTPAIGNKYPLPAFKRPVNDDLL